MKRLLLLLCIAGFLFAEDIELNLKVAEKNIFIGDRIHISCILKGPERMKFTLPDAGRYIRDLEILEQNKSRRTEKKQQILRLELEATAFDTGFMYIPPLPVIYDDSLSDGKRDTLYFPDGYVYFRSALDTTAAPVAMKGPVPLTLMTWWEYLITAVLLALAVILLFYGLKRHKSIKSKKENIWISSGEKAGYAITELQKKNYPEQRRWKAFYLELSYILREYFENIYYLHLHELSTSEILPVLRSYVLPEHYSELHEFFHFADLVKFAKTPADKERCREDLDFVKQLIEEDRIQRESFEKMTKNNPGDAFTEGKSK